MAIERWPIPQNVIQLRSFEAPKKNAFMWGTTQNATFLKLKEVMTKAPVLALPDHGQPFILEADASGYGLGAVLMEQNKPIAFMSKALGPKATTLSTYDKEALAIIEALKKWKHFFVGSTLMIMTD